MNERKIYNEILVRNLDAAFLYWQIKDDELIAEYEKVKAEIKAMENSEDFKKSDENYIALIKRRDEELSPKVFGFKKEIILSGNDTRYKYTGTISDSLMSRKLRQVSKDDENAIRTVDDTDYTDLIINLKFKKDIMIPDGTKKKYNPDTDSIEETNDKKNKKLISKKKLRKMAYRNGITINGVHYVNFQRSSSKARTGNCLFIDEKYFKIMDEWQNMGIPFRKMISHIRDKETKEIIEYHPFVEADLVSSRSYTSLTSSSIIGTLDIAPYSILLIDDVSGEYTMEANVIETAIDKDGKKYLKATRKPYTQRTDLWDGQSLCDKSVFKKGTYYTVGKDEKIVDNHYEDKGFMLLRNHLFKTAVFNTNLQAYFDMRFDGVENPMIYDTFGNPFSTKAVLLVTTRNSCKVFKFAPMICAYLIPDEKKERLNNLEEPLNKIYEELDRCRKDVSSAKRNFSRLRNKEDSKQEEIKIAYDKLQDAIERLEKKERETENRKPEIEKIKKAIKFEQERLTWDWYREMLLKQNQEFGVCKYEKESKFGDKQQLWYQVLGSLNLDKDKLWKIAEPQVTEVNLMKKHVAFLKRGLDMRPTKDVGTSMMLQLLDVNEDVSKTKWYADYRRSQLQQILKHLYAGKIQISNSDFYVLVGNPYEMLRASVGDKIEDSIINDYEVYNSRYEDGEELYGFRSPHICSGNCALLKNTYRKEFEEWFNFKDRRILIMNIWGKGAFLSPTWNGQDTDSDSVYLGNNPIILEAVREVQDYLIPINGLLPEAKMMEFTEDNMAVVDGQLCNDFIGKICNLARDLQSFYWHLYNTGTKENRKKYLEMIYDDICILEVLSNIAIDSAKRRYDINIASEISRMRDRPYLKEKGAIISDGKITISETRYKKSLSEEAIKKYESFVQRRNEATNQAQIEEINRKIDNLLKVTKTYLIRPEFTKGLKSEPKKRKKRNFENDEERKLYIEKQRAYAEEQKALKEKVYHKLENPMDMLTDVIKEHLERADRTERITFVDILKKIPKGVKADSNCIAKIKEICLDGIQKMNTIQKQFDGNNLSFDEMYEEKQNTEKLIIHTLKYSRGKERTISVWDIHKLIRDVYDTHPQKDKHGKVMLDEEGKTIIADKRDPDIIDARVGGLLLQWVYAAFPDEFIEAIRYNEGKTSYVVEVENETSFKKEKSVNSLKDLGKLMDDEPIYELDGHYYKIRYRYNRKRNKNIA